MKKRNFVRARGRPGRRKQPGEMNGLERAFHEATQNWVGIAALEYERITLKLAHDTRYTPDFYMLRETGTIQFYECKGFMEDHARVKIKVAAEMFPEFEFYLVRRRKKADGGGWDIQRVGTADTQIGATCD